MDLRELKILFDWSKKELDKYEGSKITKPDLYLLAKGRYNTVKYFFDIRCDAEIKKLELEMESNKQD